MRPVTRKWITFPAIIGMVVAVTLIVSVTLGGRDAAAGPQSDIHDGILGSWHFRYAIPQPEADGTYVVSADYPRGSAADVRAAVAALNEHATQLAQGGTPFPATLVFARPLTVEEFTSFIRSAGVTPTGSTMRALQPDGTRVTVNMPPVWATDGQGHTLFGQPAPGGAPLDPAILQRRQQGHFANNRVIGVISTDVELNAATYDKVRKAPEVVAIDALPLVVTAQVQQQRAGTSAKHISVIRPQLYWAMEDTGLATSR